jgi:paraquat-inducible protein B
MSLPPDQHPQTDLQQSGSQQNDLHQPDLGQPDVRQPDPGAPPRPVIKTMRWPFPIIWIVPVLAACLAFYYIREHQQETGQEITIQLDDSAGIRPGETVVAVHGVTIGHVKAVELTPDHLHAIEHVQLERSASSVAKTGTLFWMVRPEVSLQSITGLNTIVTGPFIDCRPGEGDPCTAFIALSAAPTVLGPGIKLILSAEQIAQLNVDSPVNYRGIQVGLVKDIRLSSTADSVNVTIFIWERYKALVRTNSEFWLIKGADLQGSIFSGLKLKIGSLQNILSGGVSFATPEKNYGEFVTDGQSFVLHDQAKDEWMKWRAQIQLPPEPPANESQQEAAAVKKQSENSKKD